MLHVSDIWEFVRIMSYKQAGDDVEMDIEVLCRYLAEVYCMDNPHAAKPLIAWALGKLSKSCTWMEMNKFPLACALQEGFASIGDDHYGKGRTAGAIALIGGGAVFRAWVEGLVETRTFLQRQAGRVTC